MTARDDLRARVVRLLHELNELGDELTIVGGTAPALYEISQAVPIRPTEDIDVVIESKGPAQWNRLVRKIEDRGFRYAGAGAPICRYVKGDLQINVMPTDDSLGFSNRWYAEAVANRIKTDFGVHVIAPLYFIATKLVAYTDPERGGGNPFMSIDLDDIVVVVRGIPELLAEIRIGTADVHVFVREQLSALFSGADGLDIVRSHLEGDAGTQALAPALLAGILDACAIIP